MKTIITQIAIICILVIPIFVQLEYIHSSSTEPEPSRKLAIIYSQEQSMVDLESAEQYVNEKIEAKLEVIKVHNDKKEELHTKAKESYEAYPASLKRQQQVTYTSYAQSISTEESVGSGSIGSYELTAYTWTGNTCANGEYPTDGVTIASNTLPLGTRVYIEGLGERVVQDTGGMGGGVIDVYMDSYDACIQFGRQSAEVYVLE